MSNFVTIYPACWNGCSVTTMSNILNDTKAVKIIRTSTYQERAFTERPTGQVIVSYNQHVNRMENQEKNRRKH